ncbi:MAG TPA: DUF4349 domain-containing protein [Candidatus Limnocylindrales bacterium]|nr:DUF4349 domain-containing protein [Candidatus Limnocylindrales bacterium]
MRAIRSFLPLIAIALVLAACSGSSSSALSTVGQPVAAPAAKDQAAGGASEGQPPADGVPQPVTGQGGGPVAAVDDAKIIRTGTMSLEVSDLNAALRTARDGIVGLGGYVGASTTSNQQDQPSATITYRIPSAKWESAIDLLHGLGGLTTKVVTEHTEAVEVTGQVVDLEANIANLKASETALQGIAEKATKISDVLEVEAQLTTTRGQIQTLEAQLKDLNDRSSYAAMTVDYNVPVVAVQVASKGWDPAMVVDEAAATMVSVLQNLGTAGIWFLIVWLPILLVVGAASLGIVWIARRLGSRRDAPMTPPPAAPIAEG